MNSTTRYAKSGDVHIAYQTFGEGPLDVAFMPGFISHVEHAWEEPKRARWLRRLATFSRVILFDKRGTGLSDPVEALPGMDERMDDFRAVMDAVGVERAALLGVSDGGPLAGLFAATHPDRCLSLVFYGAFASFSSWMTEEELRRFFEYVDNAWGSGGIAARICPTMAGDSAFQEWMGKFERLGASPGAVKRIMRMNSQIDITDILPTIQAPTLIMHRTDDQMVNVEGSRTLARSIPVARYIELPGRDHLPWIGDDDEQIIGTIEEFLTGHKSAPETDRVLATIVFTDIVGSTERAEKLGDAAWHDFLTIHDRTVRQELARFGGKEVKSLGDGFLARFERPARAINCAVALVEALQRIDIGIRVGIHCGEVDLSREDVHGVAVNIASRVANLGNVKDILVTRTVKDLVGGSGISFDDFGLHTLKGITDEWQLLRVRAASSTN